MRNVVKAVLVMVGLALVFGSVPVGYAGAPSFVTLGDDSVPNGQRDRYSAKCLGQTDITGTVDADVATDEFKVVVVCTSGVADNKGVKDDDTGVGGASATVGPKCERVDVDVICVNGGCPGGGDCGGYSVTVECVGKGIEKMELVADDVP